VPHYPVMTREPTDSTAAAGQADDWARLCMLLDDDPELAPAVRLAIEDPQAYRAEQQVVPGLPGAVPPPVTGPWQALLDGLDDAGALAYLDVGDAGMELAEVLAALPRVVGSGIDLEEVIDLEGDLSGIIAVADALLAARGLRIVELEEEADACALVVVPAGHVAEVVALVSQLGQVARGFS